MTDVVRVVGYGPIGDQVGADVELHISGEPPDFSQQELSTEDYTAAIGGFYVSQAMTITRLLLDNLPQGTVHRMLILLLEGYASHYRGKTDMPKGKRKGE